MRKMSKTGEAILVLSVLAVIIAVSLLVGFSVTMPAPEEPEEIESGLCSQTVRVVERWGEWRIMNSLNQFDGTSAVWRRRSRTVFLFDADNTNHFCSSLVESEGREAIEKNTPICVLWELICF